MIFQKSREISVLLVIQRNAEELALTSDFILSILYTHGIKSSGQAVSLNGHSCRSRGKMNAFLQVALTLMFIATAFKGKKLTSVLRKYQYFLRTDVAASPFAKYLHYRPKSCQNFFLVVESPLTQ